MDFLMFRNDCFFGKNTISPDFKAGHLQTRGFFFLNKLIFSTKKHKKKEEKKKTQIPASWQQNLSTLDFIR